MTGGSGVSGAASGLCGGAGCVGIGVGSGVGVVTTVLPATR
jgi:hypothetical protein